jgi:hypothetical protein
MLRPLLTSILVSLVLACDGGGSSPDDCPELTCGLMCPDGLARGADGCEVCVCNPTPDSSCTVDADCVLAVDYEDCCGCRSAYNASSIEGHSCIRAVNEPAPPGCVREDCGAMCRCEFPIRAACESGTCTARTDCPMGEIMELGGCVPACTGHADCTVAADYGSCCGGCQPMTRATVDASPCLAERASDSECSPAPGSCDGLGCPSPALDCVMSGGSAVCMADGTCQLGGAGGECPAGSMEMDGVCVPAP